MILKATNLKQRPVPWRLLFGPPDLSKNAGATLLLCELCRCLGRKVSAWDLFVGFAMLCNHHGKMAVVVGNLEKIFGKYEGNVLETPFLSFLPLYLMGEPMVFHHHFWISRAVPGLFFSKMMWTYLSNGGIWPIEPMKFVFHPKKKTHWSANLTKKYRDWLNQEMYAYTPISYLIYIYMRVCVYLSI